MTLINVTHGSDSWSQWHTYAGYTTYMIGSWSSKIWATCFSFHRTPGDCFVLEAPWFLCWQAGIGWQDAGKAIVTHCTTPQIDPAGWLSLKSCNLIGSEHTGWHRWYNLVETEIMSLWSLMQNGYQLIIIAEIMISDHEMSSSCSGCKNGHHFGSLWIHKIN